jgi:uncharacterized repeat protein (TIGR01451 family)
MKSHFLPHTARALALVLLIAAVAALAVSNAAWAGPSQVGLQRQPGRSTVPRRGTDLVITQTYRRVWWDDVIFTTTVTNTGPIAAQDVFVTDRISKRLELEEVATSKGACVGDPIVKCRLGNLAVGEVVTITIRVGIWLDRYPGTITNTATVDSRTRDVKPSNNAATVSFKGRNSDFPWFDSLKPGF